jgi:hypothetical protein
VVGREVEEAMVVGAVGVAVMGVAVMGLKGM